MRIYIGLVLPGVGGRQQGGAVSLPGRPAVDKDPLGEQRPVPAALAGDTRGARPCHRCFQGDGQGAPRGLQGLIDRFLQARDHWPRGFMD